MNLLTSFMGSVSRFGTRVRSGSASLWRRYRGLKRHYRIGIALLLLLTIGGIVALALQGGKSEEAASPHRTVTVRSVGELTGGGSSVSVVGSVRSVAEAQVLAQSGGTVRSVHTRIGASVPAGFIIAQLENAAERAQVLQAQGSYEAALAARSITLVQAAGTGDSLEEARLSARNTYRGTYTTIDNALENHVDPLLRGVERAPEAGAKLAAERDAIAELLAAWQRSLSTADQKDPEALISDAEAITRRVSVFLVEVAQVVNARNSGVSDSRKAGIATARASVDGVLATLSAQREALRASQTAASVASRQTTSTQNRTASADASVKQALGSLRLAQASLERTIVRAPIGGTVNFLPIRVGDYLTAFTHAATIANNGSLEIVTYVSEEDRELIAVGETVRVEDAYDGVVTVIAPALDPATRRIEVRIAVAADTDLVSGQSVRIAFRSLAPRAQVASGPTLLPLASVKLRASDRVVFTVSAEGRLVAVPVEIGEVRGDRIEITSALPADVRIVTDARGLSDGQQVTVAPGV